MTGAFVLTPAVAPNGTAAVTSPQRMIIEQTSKLCAQVYNGSLRSLVLTGSVARDEGTFVPTAKGAVLLGDAEFFVVFQDGHPLPPSADLKLLARKIQERLSRRDVAASISLDAIHARYFRGVRPSIFGYELGKCGVVAWGDPDVLKLVPPFAAKDIPLEDGWRLLANRLVEQLEGFDDLAAGRPSLSTEIHYRSVKLCLDMATSLLIFTGGYAPTYAERAEAIARLHASDAVPSAFPLEAFARDIAVATRWKLGSATPPIPASREFWERAIDYAEALWGWELARLTGHPVDGAWADILRVWLRRQPLAARLRGWAHVARRQGLQASLFHGPRWLRSAFTGSPRYLVYAVAVPMVFALRHAAQSNGNTHSDGCMSQLQRHLPLPSPTAQAVLDNYRQFLTGTRA